MTTDPDRMLEELSELSTAVVDTSSLIYAERAGFYDTMVEVLDLVTVSGVAAEIGAPPAGVKTIVPADASLPVDTQVVELACRLHVPVISDDRKLLERADRAGCRCFNALLVLELLLLCGRLSLAEREVARRSLLSAARYSPRVIHTADEVHWEVRKRTG